MGRVISIFSTWTDLAWALFKSHWKTNWRLHVRHRFAFLSIRGNKVGYEKYNEVSWALILVTAPFKTNDVRRIVLAESVLWRGYFSSHSQGGGNLNLRHPYQNLWPLFTKLLRRTQIDVFWFCILIHSK